MSNDSTLSQSTGDSQPGSSTSSKASPFATELKLRDERLAGFKKLIDVLGHDFNNMLVPVLGYVGLLKEELDPASAARTFIDKIEVAARKSEKAIDSFLTTVRPRRRFEPQPADFREAVESAVREWQAGLSPAAGIKVELSAASCPGVFDPKLIGMLMAQLLSNARYALALGGTARISLQPVTLSSERAGELGVPESLYELTVADDGFGIPAEILPRVWNPFFTTRPKGQALGLGLTAVHSVAQLHGGQAVIESTENSGTKVIVWLAREPRSSIDEAASHRGAATASAKRALLVEGDPVTREVLKGRIEEIGFEVVAAAEAAEGLKHFQRKPEMFHIAVYGAEAARGDDWALLKRVRALVSDLPIVILATGAEKETEGALSGFGPKRLRVIWKPATVMSLRGAIQKAMV